LYGLMSLERAFLRIGINLPVGGSRLVIAQREPAASTH
jgi:hypothetical protein